MFADVPALDQGDRIELIVDGDTLNYVVSSVSVVRCWGESYMPDGDLVLDTSAPQRRAVIITATAT